MIQIKKDKLQLLAGFFLLLFPMFNMSMSPVMMPGSVRFYYVLAGLILLFSYKNTGFIVRYQKKSIILIAFLAFFILRKNNDLQRGNFFPPIYYLAVFLVMTLLQKDTEWWEPMWQAIRVFCVFHLIAGIILLLNRPFLLNVVVPAMKLTDHGTRVVTRFINSGYMTGLTNHYSLMGMYMALGICAFATPLLIGKKETTIWDWGGIVLFLIGVILTAKRAHFLFSVLAIAFVYWLINRPFTVKQYRNVFLILLALSVLIPILYLTIPQFQSLIGRFMTDYEDLNDASNGRVDKLWMSAIDMFLKHPLFGIGWKQFRVLNVQQYGALTANDTHNIYLQLLAETGIAGTAVYLFLFISGFVLSCKAEKAQKKQPYLTEKQVVYLRISMVYQVFFLLYGITGNPLYDIYCFVPYFLSVTVGYSAWRTLQMHRKKMRQTGVTAQ